MNNTDKTRKALEMAREELNRLTFKDAKITLALSAIYTALSQESWYGHKFKEVETGVWRCHCGKVITEAFWGATE